MSNKGKRYERGERGRVFKGLYKNQANKLLLHHKERAFVYLHLPFCAFFQQPP
jgi:hypothetical protein